MNYLCCYRVLLGISFYSFPAFSTLFLLTPQLFSSETSHQITLSVRNIKNLMSLKMFVQKMELKAL